MQKLLESKNKNKSENEKQIESKNEAKTFSFLFPFLFSFSFLFLFSLSFLFLFSFSFLFSFLFFFCFYFYFFFLILLWQLYATIVFFRKDVLQKRSKFTGDHPCRSVISIKLHSKNSSINLHIWQHLTVLDDIKIKVSNVGYNLL